MLRVSVETTGTPLDLRGVVDTSVDPLVPHGPALIRFATASISGTDEDVTSARSALAEAAGEAAMVRAAGVIGNFQMMNRLVDAVGVPIPAPLAEIATDLGLDH